MTHTLTIRPGWSPLTIIMMVLGFMLFWPLGLAMLAYILWGDRLHEFRRDAAGARREFGHAFGCGPRMTAQSGNIAFDEYRQRELRRLEEERRRLEDERREFESFVRNLRRAKDQEEFDRFMADRRASRTGDATAL